MEVVMPRDLSNKLMQLSADYGVYAGKFADHLKLQADFFNTNRSNFKSDNATQKAFDATKEGVTMNILKLKLKAVEKEMSAIKTHLRLLETEAKNIF